MLYKGDNDFNHHLDHDYMPWNNFNMCKSKIYMYISIRAGKVSHIIGEVGLGLEG